jgi:hypothetical protein
MSELRTAIRHKATVWLIATCDKHQTSPIHDFWAEQWHWIENHLTLLSSFQNEDPSFATNFLYQLQLTEDIFLRDCAQLTALGTPNTRILDAFNEGWRRNLEYHRVGTVILPRWLQTLYEKRMGKKREAPSSSGRGAGTTKKPKSDHQQQQSNQPVINPSINSEISKKFLQNYTNNRKKLVDTIPRLYKEGPRSSQRCVNFDIRGKCKASCPRSHATASPACYAAIWETAKGVVGE